jgi:hypothetical protein
MYDKKAGYSGKQHGEINDKNPAPNAKKRFKSVISSNPCSIFLFILSKKRTFLLFFLLSLL